MSPLFPAAFSYTRRKKFCELIRVWFYLWCHKCYPSLWQCPSVCWPFLLRGALLNYCHLWILCFVIKMTQINFAAGKALNAWLTENFEVMASFIFKYVNRLIINKRGEGPDVLDFLHSSRITTHRINSSLIRGVSFAPAVFTWTGSWLTEAEWCFWVESASPR